MGKIAIIGGGGLRTPLLIYGLGQSHSVLNTSELVLYDVDPQRATTMARLGEEILRRQGVSFKIRASTALEDAVEGADYVLNSVRVGGISARARDERIAMEHGFAGQETTGPGGAAMALRTLPVTLGHAHIVERRAPKAWFINFTNPAGLITQALTQNTGLKVIGICDTPSELFFRISLELRVPLHELEFDYAGLNHLGWVRRVLHGGRDVIEQLLADDRLLRRLYPAELFDPALIQTLGLIPTEYLFFYYSQRKAYENEVRAGATRGEELERLNRELFQSLHTQSPEGALEVYTTYLLRRNASYMKLEAQGGSAFTTGEEHYDPFDTPTGYHRIALDVMTCLATGHGRPIVLNVPNRGAIADLEADDVVEVPCDVDQEGAHARPTGRLPDSVRGMVQSVKAYERTAIRAALAGSSALARLAMLEYPIIGQWEPAVGLLSALRESDPEHLGYLK